MPYLKEIDDLIREAIGKKRDMESKKMFGGICHLYRGNMFCGVYKDNLILRLGDGEARRAISEGEGRPFDITGKAMKGWLMVPWNDAITGEKVEAWIGMALDFVKSLPPK
jgi:hypothetical protein